MRMYLKKDQNNSKEVIIRQNLSPLLTSSTNALKQLPFERKNGENTEEYSSQYFKPEVEINAASNEESNQEINLLDHSDEDFEPVSLIYSLYFKISYLFYFVFYLRK